MNDAREQLACALEAYAAVLDQLEPSERLQARMQAAIQFEVGRRPRHAQVRRWGWAVAASLALAVTGFAVLRYTQQDQLLTARRALPANADRMTSTTVFPTGVVSLWPTQGTVFRVRSTLNGLGPQQDEQQYWIDVRMANDGSMRVERILTADGTELFARSRTEP
jgi:hypothetical protein